MGLSADDKKALEDLEFRFTYAPKGDQAIRYERLRANGKSLAQLIIECCPDGRERSLALANLEQCVMWTNAGIARGEAARE